MARHIADLSTALNSQFLDYHHTERRLQRVCGASIWFQTFHTATVQQFNTFKDLSQQDLQLQIAINANCHQHIHKLTDQLTNEWRLHRLALDRIKELNSTVSAERSMKISTPSRRQQWGRRSQSTINEPRSSRDPDSNAETSNQVSACPSAFIMSEI